MGYTYLGSPYSHIDSSVMEWRFREACRYAAAMVADGIRVFCPIAHSHPLVAYGAPQCSAKIWQYQDKPFLDGAASLSVLMLPHWYDSVGLQAEIQSALLAHKKISYITWKQGSNGSQP